MAPSAAIDLGRRFELRGVLGRGGMGTVYEAFDRARGEVVALKTMDRLEPLAAARLKHEFRVLRGISHPNLVTFHELHEHLGRIFITMERIEGGSFLEWVRGDGAGDGETGTQTIADTRTIPEVDASAATALEPVKLSEPRPAPEPPRFDEARLRSGVVQLARGLTAIHRADRVHRDVKPSNVRVTPGGRVVLLDFGIATQPEEGTDLAGTVAFMAPEQLEADGVQPAADWYAVGVLMFAAMTGRPPFVGDDVRVLYQKAAREAPAPRELVHPLPEDLERLCVGLLRREPGARPAPREIFTVVSERRREREQPEPPASRPLVGRERTLEVLLDAWDEAMHRGPVGLALEGPPGSGRTRVLEELSARLSERGALVLESRVDEREAIAYRGVDQIVAALARAEAREAKGLGKEGVWLASLFPSVWRVLTDRDASPPDALADPAEQRRRAFAVLTRWIAVVSRERPVAILIDDADGLDAGGVAALRALLAPQDDARVLVAVTRLTGGAPPPALRALRSLPLPPLSKAELSALASDALGSLGDPRRVRALVARSEGKPGPILEVAEDLRSAAVEQTVELTASVEGRFDRLDAQARELVELCALSSVPLDVSLACAATEAARGATAEALEGLRVSHLLATDPRGGGYRPPRVVRSVVSAAMEPDRRATLHARLAGALESTQPQALRAIARHWLEAGRPERALPPLTMAIQNAQARLAFESLAELCGWAERAEPSRRADWVARRAGALAWAGRGREAAQAYLDAAEATEDAHLALRHRIRAAEQYLRGGLVDAGLDVLREVLAAVGISMPVTALGALPALVGRRAQLLLRGYGYRERPAQEIDPDELLRVDACWTASALLNIDIYLGAYFQTLYILHALRCGEPSRVARSLAFESPLLAAAGRRDRAERMWTRARELAERTGDVQALGLARGTAGLALVQSGRWREARAELEEAERLLRERCPGAFWELVTTQVAHAWTLFFLGELRAQRQALHTSRAAAQARGDVFGATNLAVGMTVGSWLVEDEIDRARAALEEAMEPWSSRGYHVQHFFCLLSEVTLDLAKRDGAGAHARLVEQDPKVRRSQLLRNQLLRIVWHDTCGRACLATGRAAEAAKRAAKIDREKMAWSGPLAALLRAGAARLEGEAAEEVRQLERARHGFDEVGMTLHAAVASHGLAFHGRGAAIDDGEWAARERPRRADRFVSLLAPTY